jgi:rhomboid family GlyGly-CTERM serine protease
MSVLLAVAAVAVVIAIGGSAVGELLRYEREAILGGQLWRVFTGNLVHGGWAHLVLNIAGLGLIGLLFGQALNAQHWMFIFIACALGVGLGLLVLNPRVSWYVGLSGVLHGLFVAGALVDRYFPLRIRALLLGLLCGKLVWEQLQGPMPGTATAVSGDIVVDAHLYGAFTGLVTGVIIKFALGRR